MHFGPPLYITAKAEGLLMKISKAKIQMSNGDQSNRQHATRPLSQSVSTT